MGAAFVMRTERAAFLFEKDVEIVSGLNFCVLVKREKKVIDWMITLSKQD